MIYILDQNERLVGILDNVAPKATPYFDDKHIENITTGVHTYTFSVPADSDIAGLIQPEGYVIITDLDGKQQMFQVTITVETNNESGYVKEVDCEHVAIPELIGNIIRPITMNSVDIQTALTTILSGTGWSLGQVDYTASQDVKIDQYVTALEAITNLLQQYSMEIQYEVVLQYGKVQQRLINVTSQRGTVTNKRFQYGKDLKEVKRTIDSSNLCTALIGVGKGDSSANYVTFAGQTYTTPDGYYNKTNDYVTNDTLLAQWGKNGKHIFGVYYSNQTTPVQVFYDTVNELKNNRSQPVTQYECSIAALERISGYEADKVRVGDTITIVDITFNPALIISARILEMTRSYISPENDAVVIGDYKKIRLVDTGTLDKLQALVSQNQEKWNSTPYKIEIISSNGLIFQAGQVSSTLTAYVYRGGVDITDTIDGGNFAWTRTSDDSNDDATWNSQQTGGKSITITPNDISKKATFNCSVTIPS